MLVSSGSDRNRDLPRLLVGPILIILMVPLPKTSEGQFEHFRNHESVFKEYTPYFEHPGKNYTAVAGQTVSLNCGVRNLGDRYVSWFRSSDSQVLSSGYTKFTGDRRVKVVPAERSHTWGLKIRNVTPTDSGEYLCQVNTEPKISLAFYLNITESFAHIHGTGERYVQDGSHLQLDCRIAKTVAPGQEPPTISWFRNLTRAEDIKHIKLSKIKFRKDDMVESSLTIGSVSLGDSGVYRCTSDAATEAKVTVLVTSGEHRAAIVEENSASSVLSGSPAHLLPLVALTLCLNAGIPLSFL